MPLIRNAELLGVPLIWAIGVFGALSLPYSSLVNEHALCGPWGCGPTTSALLAMHVGWLAFLAPPMLYLPFRIHLGRKLTQYLSVCSVVVGLAGMTAIVAWQWLFWLPQAGEWSRPYIWQRCGFAIATAVDWPLTQLLLIGISLWFLIPFFRREPADATLGNLEHDPIRSTQPLSAGADPNGPSRTT